jgi:hypothetical protein
MDTKLSLVAAAVAASFLSGCWVDHIGEDSKKRTPSNPEPPAIVNHAPSITGSPPPVIREGEDYDFTPSATDPDGDPLQFSIARKPSWANFNRTTGRLWGTPDAADVGNFTNIQISVSDGDKSATLQNFDITVDAIALGQATLSWQPPVQNDDGTALVDLSGYRIYYGRSERDLTRVVVVSNPGLTRYVVESLSPAQWYFTMTTVNSQGVESGRTQVVSKTIS